MTCPICNHAKRAEIEQAILLRDFGDTEVTLRDIAKQYSLNIKDIQVHALMHVPLETLASPDSKEKSVSIASEIKRREAEILMNVMEESYVTFKNLSSKINMIVATHTIEAPTLQQITKPVSELYLGTSQSIRDTAEKIVRMNVVINGEKDQGLSSIVSLVETLRAARND